MHVHAHRPKFDAKCLLQLFHISFKTEYLSELETHWHVYDWLANLRDSLVSASHFPVGSHFADTLQLLRPMDLT